MEFVAADFITQLKCTISQSQPFPALAPLVCDESVFDAEDMHRLAGKCFAIGSHRYFPCFSGSYHISFCNDLFRFYFKGREHTEKLCDGFLKTLPTLLLTFNAP